MKNLAKVALLLSFSVSSLIYAQNYGYQQAPQYSYETNRSDYYPSQPGSPYNQGGQYNDYRYQNRYDGGMNQGYYPSTESEKNQNSWTSWYGNDDKGQKVPDEVISSNVIRNLRGTPYFSNSAKNIQVSTKDGKVTLKGKAANKNEKNQIEYMVKNVQGVDSVSNDLETEK